MATPDNYPLSITLDDVEVVQFVDFASIDFNDLLRDVSYFNFTIYNPSGVTPARDQFVIVTNTNTDEVIFTGYVMELTRRKKDNGVTQEYDLECADMKVRLQKTVLPYKEYIGTDVEILEELLNDAYPDLTDAFDFSTDVENVASDINFETNEDSLLDALNRLADRTGAKMRHKRGKKGQKITFDGFDSIANEADAPSAVPRYQLNPTGGTATVDTGGNPGNCATFAGATLIANSSQVFGMVFSSAKQITNVKFDYKITSPSAVQIQAGTGFAVSTSATVDGQWHSVDWINDVGATSWPNLSGYSVFRFRVVTAGSIFSISIDNIELVTGTPFTKGKRNELGWKRNSDPADFGFDIDLSDEFGFDFEIHEGVPDNFNSVIVIGGNEDVAIDWTYGVDGEDRVNLEKAIKSIAVYKNTGSDVSPSWAAQDVGVFGTDTLSTKDVLYDPDTHWLWFASAPANMTKSVRVTGILQKPLRVMVENVEEGEPVYAVPIYDENVKTIEEAVAIGEARLAQRNNLLRLDFTTYNPGLEVGQTVNVVDTNRGLDETQIIQRIKTKWLGGGAQARFDVECGDDAEPSADGMIAEIDKRSRKKPPSIAPTTNNILYLTDSAGNILTDSAGNFLYVVGS